VYAPTGFVLDSSRNALGRMFDHGLMKKVSNRLSDTRLFPFINEDPTVVQNLKTVAQTFVELQDKRHIADYDNGTFWTLTQTLSTVLGASRAFAL
jgi:hemerythrin-like domain-containing protein